MHSNRSFDLTRLACRRWRAWLIQNVSFFYRLFGYDVPRRSCLSYDLSEQVPHVWIVLDGFAGNDPISLLSLGSPRKLTKRQPARKEHLENNTARQRGASEAATDGAGAGDGSSLATRHGRITWTAIKEQRGHENKDAGLSAASGGVCRCIIVAGILLVALSPL